VKQQVKMAEENAIKLRGINGFIVAEVRGDCLFKRAWSSRHMLRKPQGWAFDFDILDDADYLGATWVLIIDEETGIAYSAELGAFWEQGIFIDRGYGEQLCLPLDQWATQRKPPTSDVSQYLDYYRAPQKLPTSEENEQDEQLEPKAGDGRD
jgi:hypothetical protein